jgi:hypothetical protein
MKRSGSVFHDVWYRSGAYDVSNEIEDPYSPAVLSRYRRDTLARCGMPHIKLHAARHTGATIMHLQGVPVAVIAAWIGDKDDALTMRLYAHSQDEALRAAATTVEYFVTSSVTRNVRHRDTATPRHPGHTCRSVVSGRCSSMAEHQLPKLNTRVRFPSSAP